MGILAACRSEPGYPARAGTADEAFKADLARLRDRHIYFGHQSVGQNILEGLSELLREAGETRFAIADLDQGQSLAAGGIIHSHLGENRVPRKKCDGFAKFLAASAPPLSTTAPSAPEPRFDLAAMKFCYLDVDAQTDVPGLFAYYKATLDSVQARNPTMGILYVTVPLKTGPRGRLGGLKRLLGLSNPNDADNLRRTEFNAMLRQAFTGKPLFDLAALESTYPDGSRDSVRKDGKTGYRLLSELSSDGGHLNDLGKRVAAKAFVHAMAGALSPR